MFLQQHIFHDRENFFCDIVLEVFSHDWILDQLEKYYVGFCVAEESEAQKLRFSLATLFTDVIQPVECV